MVNEDVIVYKGPLKSIMKKREERAREKTQRKESSELAAAAAAAMPPAASGVGGLTATAAAASKRSSHFKEFLELHVSKSPRHSVSMSSMVGAASAAEAAPSSVHADAGLVQRHGSAASRVPSTADAEPMVVTATRTPAESVLDPSSVQVTQDDNNFTSNINLPPTAHDDYMLSEQRTDDTQL